MTHQVLYYILSSILVITIITMIAIRPLGAEGIIRTTQIALTPNISTEITDDNVKVTVTPLEDGYLYHITAQPSLEITSNSEIDAFALLSFQDIDVKAKVVGGTGDEEDTFKTKDGTTRMKFEAELSSAIPPLQEWRPPTLEQGIPVLIKSNTGAPIIVTARVKEVIDIDSGLDLTPYQECKADFEVYCDTDLKYTHYLKFCGTDDPRRVCEQTLDVCGGSLEIIVTDNPDCSERKVTADIFYKDGRQWKPGEDVGISFWKDTECTKKYTNFNQLLYYCCPAQDRCDRIGGIEYMNAGLINP